MPSTRERVFVTSVGAVSPNGNDVDQIWSAVAAGRSGIASLTDVDVEGLPVTIGGQVRDLDVDAHLTRAEQRRLDSSSVLAVVAADEAMAAVATAGGSHPFEPSRFGIIAATGYGPTQIIHEATRALDSRGPRTVSPYSIVYGAADAASAFLSVRFDARSATHALSAACASGTVGIGEAMRTIRHGYADALLVVASEDSMNTQDLAGTTNLRALASDRNDDPQSASRPFDRARSGFVMSNGAAAILLESETSAARRGAQVLGEVVGYGCSSDAHHATAPHPDGRGAKDAMRAALADAGFAPTDIDYINAHGTGTPYNDVTELGAIGDVFGTSASQVPISSTKSTTGHMIGAAGVIEAIFCLLTIRDQLIAPTVNLDDPEFPDYDIVAGSPRRAPVYAAMSNSFGFGGHNATVILTDGADS